jgi:hypothetical protein
MFLVIQRNTNFYSEFYVHLLCEFFVMLDYDEMNYNLVYGGFVQCIMKCKLWSYAITMNIMLEWIVMLNLLRLKT